MPLIHRVTTDMFEFAEAMDYMVNPVNLLGAPGAGLALEFRKRVPDELFFSKYREACLVTKELRIGTVQVLEETEQPWGIINFPTKRHYASDSDKDDIIRGLEALRALLSEEKYRYCSIAMPMLGCGLGKQNYDVVYPLMIDHLGDLDATVFLSMAPDKTELRPTYLTVVGPLDYGVNEKEQESIKWVIDKTLEAWGTDLASYTGIVSGGYPGVDSYVCGSRFGKAAMDAGETPYQDSLAWKRTEKLPLVCRPNAHRNGVASNLHLSNLLCEIGDDIILFKPKGYNNNRMSTMQIWLQADKQERERSGLYPRRVSVFGEMEIKKAEDDILIPQVEDIPY